MTTPPISSPMPAWPTCPRRRCLPARRIGITPGFTSSWRWAAWSRWPLRSCFSRLTASANFRAGSRAARKPSPPLRRAARTRPSLRRVPRRKRDGARLAGRFQHAAAHRRYGQHDECHEWRPMRLPMRPLLRPFPRPRARERCRSILPPSARRDAGPNSATGRGRAGSSAQGLAGRSLRADQCGAAVAPACHARSAGRSERTAPTPRPSARSHDRSR